ncbi:MAG: S8 family serine peptidase [Mariniphaga sp.]|nr:S8 family serine peptidase [Mariniphaga sp.]
MSFKHFTLVVCILSLSLTGYSQRNPDNEILVFFSEGITQKIETIKGNPVKKMSFTNEELKLLLNTAGIPDSLMELALPDFKREDTLKTFTDGREIKQPDMSNLIRIKTPKGKNRKDLIKYLNSLPEVLYAELNGRASPQLEPNDYFYENGDQWGLDNPVFIHADIHAKEAWDIYTGNSNNIIAIIDGGVQTSHNDLDNKILGGDTGEGSGDWAGHGTHVAGIAAAETNSDNMSIAGVDWNARIHPQRIDDEGDAYTYQAIVDAVNYSSNVRVLNNSWVLKYENGDPGRYSTTVRQAFAYVYKANRTSVTIMGNDHDTHPNVVSYPAGFSNVIAVGATTNSFYETIRASSGRGNHIDLCAPGENILSTKNSYYYEMSGTSSAAPFVSGVASLLKGYNANLANDDIEHILQLSADEVQGMSGQDFTATYGYGRLNAESALSYLCEPYTLEQWTATSGSVQNTVGFYTMQILGASGLASANYLVRRHEVRKTVTFPESFLHIEGVWGRGAFSNGWSHANPNFGEGFCEVVPGTLTATGVTLRTYVYEVYSVNMQYLGYYPNTPANASFAYSVLGITQPSISAPDIICYGGHTVSLQDPPANTTITWGGSNVTYPYGNTGTSVTVRATSSSTISTGSITASFTIEDVPYIITKSVGINGPASEDVELNLYTSGGTPVAYMCPNTYYHIYLSNNGGCSLSDYSWSIPAAWDSMYQYNNMISVYTNSSPGGMVEVYANTCCSINAKVIIDYFGSGYCGGGYFMSFSPNPTSEETTLTINPVAEDQALKSAKTELPSFDEDVDWEYEVYSPTQVLKQKKTKIKGNKTKIQTQGWQEGIYIVRVKYWDEIITGKLQIKK